MLVRILVIFLPEVEWNLADGGDGLVEVGLGQRLHQRTVDVLRQVDVVPIRQG